MQIDDETLMALSDGQLNEAEAQRVRAAIAQDTNAQARLRQFEETRSRLRALAAQDQAAAPSDTALIARIRAAGLATRQDQQTPALPAAAPANRNRAPLAAIAAMFMAAVVGFGWWQTNETPDGAALTSEQVAALDNLPSGEGLVLADGQDMTIIASYRNGAGEFCREFETHRDEAMQIGIVCRSDGGAPWASRFAADYPVSGGFVPASGDLPELDEYLRQTDAGDPMSAEDEAAELAK